jgi:diguanylate cyclase (GGDEF)-like protein
LFDLKERLFFRLLTVILYCVTILLIALPFRFTTPITSSLFLFLNLLIILSAIYFTDMVVLFFGALGILLVLFNSSLFPQLKVFVIGLLVVTTLIVYCYCLKIKHFIRQHNVELERIEEEKNILSVELEHLCVENKALKEKLKRYAALKNLTETLSNVFSLDEAISLITDEAFKIINKASVCLLYLVDDKKQRLYLASSKTQNVHYEVKTDEGDIFDNWVFRRRTRLMIRDAKKDFRFSAHEIETGRRTDVRSLIAAPIIGVNKVLGILRLDNTSTDSYAADDLRLLDIICDLAAVAIQNTVFYQKIQNLAIVDGLTGLFVHRYFQQRFDQELTRALLTNSCFAFLMVDIDNFKGYNDKYGHIAGDLVLKQIVKLIKQNCNPGDIIARYGGEEFGILLVETNKADALKVAERIRKSVAEQKFILRREITRVTISGGVSFFPDDEKEKEDLIRRADQALYKAKTEGKNKICTS